MTNEAQNTTNTLTAVHTCGEKLKARIYHVARGIEGNAPAVVVVAAVAAGAAGAGAVVAAVVAAVAAGAVAAGAVAAGVGVGVVVVVSDFTAEHADKISEKAQKTCRKLGIVFLAAASLTTGAAVGKLTYDSVEAQETARQQAAAFNRGERMFTIPQGCKLSLKP